MASLDLALDHGDVAVADLGGLLEVGRRARRSASRARSSCSFAWIARDGVLLGLPVRHHPVALLLQDWQLGVERVEPLLRRVVGLLRERGPLDLELADAALDDVDLERHRVDLDAQRDAASSTRSMALSGRKRPVM